MKKICRDIRDKLLCKYANLFGAIKPLDYLSVDNGTINLGGYEGIEGNNIVICGDRYECSNDAVLASGIVHGLHQLTTTNTINTKFKYASYIAKGKHFVIDNIRIMTIQSEEHAFNIFKSQPSNYIFLTPMGSVSKQNEIMHSIEKEEKFKIIVMLYNAKDVNQFDNMAICSSIEDDLIKTLMTTLIFRSSSYAFSTANTTILELVFSRDIILDYEKECECYLMQLKYPFIIDDELEKVLNISKIP